MAPILLIHGSWHGAWCWEERCAPYLRRAGGGTVRAMNLRGHGGRPEPLRGVRLRDFARDVAEQVCRILDSEGGAPVLVGHSLGGAVAQKYLEMREGENWPLPSGVVLMASVPPSGVLGSTLRFGARHPGTLLAATVTTDMKRVVGTKELACEMLFDDDMPEGEALRYFECLQSESFLGFLDTMFLDRPRPERISRPLPPMLVVGAGADRVFTRREVEATAAAYGREAVFIENVAHDLMLSPRWQEAADLIREFARAIPDGSD